MDYIVTLFTKPQIEWSALDGLAFIGFVILALLLFGILCYIVALIREFIRERRYRKEENKRSDDEQGKTK